MTDLLLQPSGRWWQRVIRRRLDRRRCHVGQHCAGRDALAVAAGSHLQGREPTHGFEATREAAMQAFSKSWHRD